MRTSKEKVDELLANLPAYVDASGSEGLSAVVHTMAAMRIDVGRVVGDMLPSEPAELDRVLTQLAMYSLQARSDDATNLEFSVEGGTITELLEQLADGTVVKHVALPDPEPEPAT